MSQEDKTQERTKLLLSLGLIGACVALAFAFRSQALPVVTTAHAKEGEGGRAAQAVWFINPRKDDIRRAVSMHADIKPDREAAIYGKVAGYVLPHPVEVGTRVDPTGKNGATKVLLRLAVPGLPVHTPGLYIALALGVSVATGLVAGVAPADRAARMDPVEALRAE